MVIIRIDDNNFNQVILLSKKPVIVDFWAAWCMPCKAMEPIFSELVNDLSGTIVAGKVNVDDYPEMARNYRVQYVPTFILFRGGAAVAQMSGLRSKKQLYDMIMNNIK